ncbi:MAG: class I SAM-dependent methyltransferase [Burkholderiaceae bacterium]
MSKDPWLERWLPLLAERARGEAILEIGCGSGDDTRTLAAAGLDVIAFDRSESALEAARRQLPQARFHCQDVRAPFPIEQSELGAVIASLSLHYFRWDETLALADRIARVLRPGGVLLCRLNASDDHHFGASGFPEIEPSYFMVEGEPKRFFDEASVRRLFAKGWRTLSLEHFITPKYSRPKALWEVVLERDA